MYRIIDSRSSGKTSRLMLLAKESGAAIACANPSAMRQKALAYGITGIDVIPYSYLLDGTYTDGNVLIDELETFVKSFMDCKLIGYSLTNED